MKRLLSFLAAVGLIATSASSVVACGNKADVVKKEDKKPKENVEVVKVNPRIAKLKQQYEKNNEDIKKIDQLLKEADARDKQLDEFINELKMKMTVKQADSNELTIKKASGIKNIKKYRSAVVELEQKLIDEQTRYSESKTKYLKALDDLKALDLEELSIRAYIVENGTPNKTMVAYRDAVSEKEEFYKAKLESNSQYLEKVNDELTKVTREKEIFEGTLKGIEEGVKANKVKNEKLYAEYKSIKDEISLKTGEIFAYENMIKMSDKFPKQQIDILIDELNKAKADLKILEEKIHPYEVEIAKEKAVSDSLQKVYEDKTKQRDKYEIEISYLSRQKSLTQSKLRGYKTLLDQMKSNMKLVNEAIDKYKFISKEETRKDVMNKRIDLDNLDIWKAKKKYEKGKQALNQMDARRRSDFIKNKIVEFNDKATKIENSLPSMQEQIDKSTYEAVMLSNQVKELEKEKESIKAIRVQALKTKAELLAKNEDIKLEVNYLNQ